MNVVYGAYVSGGYVFYHWINIGQWRRKWEVHTILVLQLQSAFKQFWKLYLSLCSRIGWVVWNHPKRNICTFYIFTQIKQEWPLCNWPFHSGHRKKRTFFQVSWEKPLMRPGKRGSEQILFKLIHFAVCENKLS